MKTRERRNLCLQLFTLPAAVLISVYLYYPIFDNLFISLFDIRNFNFQKLVFVGLSNYAKLFRDSIFWRALRNTVLMTAGTIFIQLPIAFLLANILANHFGKKRLRTERLLLILLFIPVVMPTPVLAKVWRVFFAGSHATGYGPFEWIAVNYGLEKAIIRLLGTKTVLLLGEIKTAFWIVLAVQTWARIGFNLLIYRSAILTIPVEIYESADIDGAGLWTKLFRITVPLTRNVINTTIILAILGVFQLFDMVWMLTEYAGPANTTHVLATYMYSRAFRDFRTGYGSTIAMMIFVLAVSLSLIQRRLFKDVK